MKTNHEQYFKKLALAFSSLIVYRNALLQNPVTHKLYLLLEVLNSNEMDLRKTLNHYTSFMNALLENAREKALKDYFLDIVLTDQNIFSLQCESHEFDGLDPLLVQAAVHDLNNIQLLASTDFVEIQEYIKLTVCSNDFEKSTVMSLPPIPVNSMCNYAACSQIENLFFRSASWGELVKDLHSWYHVNGCGIFAQYRALTWEHASQSFRGVENPDKIELSDFISYEAEREDVIHNTLQFLMGYPANNVLIYGDRGTGKSSTVKAILNRYYAKGLRVIEVPKKYLTDFPLIIRQICKRNFKFIIFVDDLAFEDNEENYTALKAILEGGLETKPSNVLLYATSNRRHLIKEKFSDRADSISVSADDEVHSMDTMQEKLSLSDRFGLRVVFSSPDKYRFLEIVKGIAAQREIDINCEVIEREALKWELWNNGRSPRTARQFVDWLEGQINLTPSLFSDK